MKSKLLNYLFWLVIAAAFIGPGTVTTAASAGASYQFDLLWAMAFSVIACIILQEAAARITVMSEISLGEAIQQRFSSLKFIWFIGISIFLGCLAYEAGNILGAISGLELLDLGAPTWVFTTVLVVVSLLLLYSGNTEQVPNILGGLVALMGLALFYAATKIHINWSAVATGFFKPSLPKGGTMVALALIGTTIVPYNIFLGSGLAQGKTLSSVRSGLVVSILVGGIISISVLFLGSSLPSDFSFKSLFDQLVSEHGQWMGYVFVFGLFGAGFTSTMTAALAGAITIRSIHPKGKKWSDQSIQFRGLWLLVVLVGFGFGVSGVKPVPVIIAAQAANGFILPILALVLWIIVNNASIVGEQRNSQWLNLAMAITLFVTGVLGGINLLKAIYSAVGKTFQFENTEQIIVSAFAIILLGIGLVKVQNERKLTHNSL